MSAQDVINALNKQKAESMGINFDDDQDANPLLKRRTLEEMDVSNYTRGQAVAFAARLGATDTVRGASQLTGIGEEETKKEQLMLNQLMKNKDYGGYVTAAYFGGLIADPAGWIIPFAKARSIYKMAKYGLISGGIAGATGYVDEDMDSLIGEGKMTRTEQTMIGVVGGGTIAPLAGGIGNLVNKVRGRPVVPLREKIIPENVKPVEILTKSADDVAEAAIKKPTITNDELENVVDLKLSRDSSGKLKSVKKLVDGKDFNVKQKESRALGPVRQFFHEIKYGDANFISRAVMQNPFGPLGAVIGGISGYENPPNWAEFEDDTGILKKLTGALIGTAVGGVAGVSVKKIPLGFRKDSDNLGELFARNFRDRYGLRDQQQYKDALTRFRSDQGNFYGRLGNAQEIAAKLSPEDNQILYRMLTGEIDPVTPKDVNLLKTMEGLTEEQQLQKLKGLRELKKEVRTAITELGQQMVDDGLLDPRTFRENVDTYLHRKYIQYEDIADRFIKDDVKRDAFNRTFKGAFSDLRTNADELKPRGILREIKVEDWNKFKKISSQEHLKTMSKKMGFDDIASAKKIDMVIGKEEVHKGWELFGPGVVDLKKIKGKYFKIFDDGTRELVKPNAKGETVVKIRWQLSKAQRLALGEIEDASVAIFETGRLMAGDLSVNKFYNKLGSEGIASTASDLTKSGLTNKQIERSYTLIPDTEIGETGIKAYGSAGGKYVPNAVAYDLEQFNKYSNFLSGKKDFAPGGLISKTTQTVGDTFPRLRTGFLTMQQLWKKTKTAYNPAVHTNNIMSNMVLFDLAIKGDVYGVKNMGQYHAKYLREAFQSIKNKDGFYKLAERQGLFDKDFLRQETTELNQYLNKLYDKAYKDGEDLDGIAGRMMEAIGKTKGAVDFFGKYANAAEQIYRKEDHIFRLAIMKQRLDLGLDAKVVNGIVEGGLEMQRSANKALTDFEKVALRNVMNGTITNVDSPELKYVRDILDHATQQGTKWFIDYDIQAPAINLLRSTALPFLAYTYRVIPLLAEASLTQPAKFAKWAALGYGLQSIGSSLAKGDTEKERNFMSKDDQQRVFSLPFLPHRMVKVPVNMGGNPTYIDITRWTPGGDVFEMRQGDGKWPFLPTPLQPSFGGIGAIAYGMVGYDPYTAQPVAGLGVPGWFDATTKLKNIAYNFIPNVAVIPGTYAAKKVTRAIREGGTRFQDDLTPIQAFLDTIGIKLKPADLRTLEFRKQAELRRQLDSIQEASSKLYLDLQKKEKIGFTEKTYFKKIKELEEQRTKLLNEYSEIFNKSFDDDKDDPIKNGVWPNLTEEQIKQMNLDIFKFIQENNMGTISGTTQ
jgi:hypothetical protein